MRTTIDISDTQRAILLGLAARRGLRGYSLLIQEALARYLRLPPRARGARKRPRDAKKTELIGFLCDGFSTGRKDGSVRHDDFIYRSG